MKAILVVDIPDFVNTFDGVLKPIGTVGKLEIGYGSDDGEMTRFEFVNIDEALLKPMPQKLDANYWHRMFGGTYKEREAKGYGYNACIDEILGEEE